MKVEHANKIIQNPYITEKTFELVETEKKNLLHCRKNSIKISNKGCNKYSL